MAYFVLNSLGLLTALPLVIDGLIVFMNSYENYLELRYIYYEDFVAKILPSLIYIVTKKNEDCFNCFNRLAPQTFSIVQYSADERAKDLVSPSQWRRTSMRKGSQGSTFSKQFAHANPSPLLLNMERSSRP